VVITHLPFATDVAPADILFPEVKIVITERLFHDVEGIKKNVTAKLNAVPLDATFKKM
jgi:hypothetical protein